MFAQTLIVCLAGFAGAFFFAMQMFGGPAQVPGQTNASTRGSATSFVNDKVGFSLELNPKWQAAPRSTDPYNVKRGAELGYIAGSDIGSRSVMVCEAKHCGTRVWLSIVAGSYGSWVSGDFREQSEKSASGFVNSVLNNNGCYGSTEDDVEPISEAGAKGYRGHCYKRVYENGRPVPGERALTRIVDVYLWKNRVVALTASTREFDEDLSNIVLNEIAKGFKITE